MQKDIETLKNKAISAGIDLRLDLDAIAARVRNFNNHYDELTTFKSAIPLLLPAGYDRYDTSHDAIGAIQRDLIKLNARILRSEGKSGLVSWNSNRWDYLDMYTSPPQGAAIQPISLNMMNKERRGCAFNLTNAEDTDKTITVTINGLEEAGNPDLVKLYKVGCVDTATNILVADLLQEITKGPSGYTVDIPAGMTQQLWVEFAPIALPQGTHAGTILAADGAAISTINFNIMISRGFHFCFHRRLRLRI